MSPSRLRTLGLAALLHDIGKVAIDDVVLTKPGQLTTQEYEAVKAHSAHGWEMLQDEPTLRAVAPLVRGHHERADGKGYPDGLSGQQISLDQGLISAVDAYDAMTHNRQYRAGMDQDRAVQILLANVGTQFLGPAVDLLLAHLEQEATVPTVNPFAQLGIREETGQDTGEVCGSLPQNPQI